MSKIKRFSLFVALPYENCPSMNIKVCVDPKNCFFNDSDIKEEISVLIQDQANVYPTIKNLEENLFSSKGIILPGGQVFWIENKEVEKNQTEIPKAKQKFLSEKKWQFSPRWAKSKSRYF